MRRNLEGGTDKADQIRLQNHRLGVTASNPKSVPTFVIILAGALKDLYLTTTFTVVIFLFLPVILMK
jgi:hypothetical protein